MSNEKLHMPNSHTTINNLDILNTLAVSKYLKKFKFTEVQAEALSNVLKKNQDAMISHKDIEDRLATKSDIESVKSEIKELRSDTKSDIAELKVSMIKWQVGTMLMLSAVATSLVKF